MCICEFYVSQDFICLIVIIYIVFGFRQTQPHAFNKVTTNTYVVTSLKVSEYLIYKKWNIT